MTAFIVDAKKDIAELLRRTSTAEGELDIEGVPKSPVDSVAEFQALNSWLEDKSNYRNLVSEKSMSETCHKEKIILPHCRKELSRLWVVQALPI